MSLALWRLASLSALLCLSLVQAYLGLTFAGGGPDPSARLRARTPRAPRAAQSPEVAARTRHVPGRRLYGKRKNTRRPYIPEPSNRRNIAWVLILSGLAGYQAGGGYLEERYQSNSAPEFAYSSPVIEQGCVLMARPGDEFADHQQYFHKSAVLILKHNDVDGYDQGIIINRPTGFNTRQLGMKGPAWNIWFGGDCEGLRAPHYTQVKTFCLHVSNKFAEMSKEVAKGVYLIRFDLAQELVSQGRATTDDFMLFFGYCGWGRNQLHRELEAGVWKMASIDSHIIVRELREETRELRALPEIGLDDGIGVWRHLYSLVDADMPAKKDPREASMMGIDAVEGDAIADAMLRQWLIQNLTPP
mmetsp:Transcript_24272/g.45896  ORF Transcript_24272/g.45896 Transcript_24272/m.45896 type:complete len:359 (-) Transcript_24272:358-1434(-)